VADEDELDPDAQRRDGGAEAARHGDAAARTAWVGELHAGVTRH
jgi:hypothetical protein